MYKFMFLCVIFVGCVLTSCAPVSNSSYNGSVTMHRRDGKIYLMEIKYTNGVTINVRNKQEAANAIEQLEKTVKDLKAGREEMVD